MLETSLTTNWEIVPIEITVQGMKLILWLSQWKLQEPQILICPLSFLSILAYILICLGFYLKLMNNLKYIFLSLHSKIEIEEQDSHLLYTESELDKKKKGVKCILGDCF